MQRNECANSHRGSYANYAYVERVLCVVFVFFVLVPVVEGCCRGAPPDPTFVDK
jgi:hypothetical protein